MVTKYLGVENGCFFSKRVTWREALEDKFQSDEESILAVEEGEVSITEDDGEDDDDDD